MAAEPDDIECTAFDRSAMSDRNVLFTPPCACPRCRPDPTVESDGASTIWLPIDGRPVRHEVTALELGSTGSSLLG